MKEILRKQIAQLFGDNPDSYGKDVDIFEFFDKERAFIGGLPDFDERVTQKTKGAINNKGGEVASITGFYRFTLEDIYTGKKRVIVYRNLIPTVARTAIAQHLTNSSPTPSTLKINYSALGTGTSVPVNSDTQLQTEIYRKVISSTTNASNVGYITAFYTALEVTGTFREAGLFINGSASANSGVLFSRVAINITKTNTETLTIDYTVTIT